MCFSQSVSQSGAHYRSITRKPAVTRLVLRFVDLECAAIEVLAVQRLHGARSIRAGHLDEAEAAGTAGIAIVDQRYLLHRAMSSEEIANGFFSDRERKVSDIKFSH